MTHDATVLLGILSVSSLCIALVASSSPSRTSLGRDRAPHTKGAEEMMRWFFRRKKPGMPDGRRMSFFMGDGMGTGYDEMEAIYVVQEWKDGKYRFGNLPWAILDAWNVCQAVMPQDYPKWSYERRREWVARQSELLTAANAGEPKL